MGHYFLDTQYVDSVQGQALSPFSFLKVGYRFKKNRIRFFRSNPDPILSREGKELKVFR